MRGINELEPHVTGANNFFPLQYIITDFFTRYGREIIKSINNLSENTEYQAHMNYFFFYESPFPLCRDQIASGRVSSISTFARDVLTPFLDQYQEVIDQKKTNRSCQKPDHSLDGVDSQKQSAEYFGTITYTPEMISAGFNLTFQSFYIWLMAIKHDLLLEGISYNLIIQYSERYMDNIFDDIIFPQMTLSLSSREGLNNLLARGTWHTDGVGRVRESARGRIVDTLSIPIEQRLATYKKEKQGRRRNWIIGTSDLTAQLRVGQQNRNTDEGIMYSQLPEGFNLVPGFHTNVDSTVVEELKNGMLAQKKEQIKRGMVGNKRSMCPALSQKEILRMIFRALNDGFVKITTETVDEIHKSNSKDSL